MHSHDVAVKLVLGGNDFVMNIGITQAVISVEIKIAFNLNPNVIRYKQPLKGICIKWICLNFR